MYLNEAMGEEGLAAALPGSVSSMSLPIVHIPVFVSVCFRPVMSLMRNKKKQKNSPSIALVL